MRRDPFMTANTQVRRGILRGPGQLTLHPAHSPNLCERSEPMSERTCSVDGCPKKVKTSGWCSMHYERWRRTGDIGPAHSRLGLPKSSCAVEDCDIDAACKGWCFKHHARWKRYGDPTYAPPPPPARVLTAGDMLARSAEADFGCRIWQRNINNKGYGVIRNDGGPQYAHRVMYEIVVGPIPDGLELDHLCRQPACIAPHHLEPVTHGENLRRGWQVALQCRRLGHEISVGHRACRSCHTANPLADAACQAIKDWDETAQAECQGAWLA